MQFMISYLTDYKEREAGNLGGNGFGVTPPGLTNPVRIPISPLSINYSFHDSRPFHDFCCSLTMFRISVS